MALNEYDVGDYVHIAATWTSAGAVTDPTASTLYVKNPAGTELGPYSMTKESKGIYSYDLLIDSASSTTFTNGVYHYGARATGTLVAAVQGSFKVNEWKA